MTRVWTSPKTSPSGAPRFAEADTLPPLLGALLLARSWRQTEPVQRQAWLAPLLAGLYLRRRGRTEAHLLSFTLGLRLLRPKPHRGASLAEASAGIWQSSTPPRGRGLAQHDRLMLAKALLARKAGDAGKPRPCHASPRCSSTPPSQRADDRRKPSRSARQAAQICSATWGNLRERSPDASATAPGPSDKARA